MSKNGPLISVFILYSDQPLDPTSIYVYLPQCEFKRVALNMTGVVCLDCQKA